MNTSSLARASARPSFEQVLIGFAGFVHILTAIALLLTPAWFFEHIGTFPPYNRHYAGDLGAFQLGMGVGLLLAARDPERHRLLIATVALGNLLHVFNHMYDALISRAPLSYWLSDTAPLFFFTIVLLLLGTGAFKRAGQAQSKTV